MVAEAFILINTQIGAEEEVLKSLKDIKEVEEAYTVYGVYDIIVKVRAEDLNKLREVVTWKIRKLKKVMSTTTMIIMEGGKRG